MGFAGCFRGGIADKVMLRERPVDGEEVSGLQLHHCNLCFCHHRAFTLCVYLPIVFHLPVNSRVITDEGITLLSVTSTNDICHNSISEEGHILRYQGLGLQHIFLGNAIQPITGILRM